MHQQGLQLIIRQKLRDGTLPYNSIPRVWGGPGNGEACDACDGIITKDELVIEGIALAGGRKPLQLHAECFHLWEIERHDDIVGKTAPPIRAADDGPDGR
jgi:hypothetical protein